MPTLTVLAADILGAGVAVLVAGRAHPRHMLTDQGPADVLGALIAVVDTGHTFVRDVAAAPVPVTHVDRAGLAVVLAGLPEGAGGRLFVRDRMVRVTEVNRYAPEIVDKDVGAQDVLAPDVLAPDVLAPDVLAQVVFAKDVVTQDFGAKVVGTQRLAWRVEPALAVHVHDRLARERRSQAEIHGHSEVWAHTRRAS